MTTDKTSHVACQGCGTDTATSFQCPLCQAEGATDRGYFCSQECFAKNWLEHRNTLHKSGVVRERRAPAAAAETAAESDKASKKNKKRSREVAAAAVAAGGDADAEIAKTVFCPWPALPSAEVCATRNDAQIHPELPLDAPRAVVRPRVAAAAHPTNGTAAAGKSAPSASSLESYFWSALLSAALYAMRSVTADAAMQVLVVAGDVYSAHAFAWAARCVGLTGLLQLAVTTNTNTATKKSSTAAAAGAAAAAAAEGSAFSPSRYFTAQKRIVIATSAVVRASAQAECAASSAVSGAAALWLSAVAPSHALLLTLPDVVDAADLQGVQTRAVFFTGPDGLKDEEDDEKDEDNNSRSAADSSSSTTGHAGVKASYTYALVEVMCEDGTPLRWSPVTAPAPGTSASSLLLQPVEDAAAAAELREKPDVTEEERQEGQVTAVEDARQLDGPLHPSTRLSNDICTCFANGDVAGALRLLVRFYQDRPGHFESNLFYLLCANWGAASLAHAHHRLAYVARFFADQSTRFAAKKNATLVDAAMRAVAAVVRLLPRLRDAEAEAAVRAATTTTATSEEKPKKSSKKAQKADAATSAAAAATAVNAEDDSASDSAMPTLATTTRPTLPVSDVSPPTALEVARLANYYTHIPNLQLQATVCYLYPFASPAVLDTFARAWGLHRYLEGPSALAEVAKARSAAALRVRQRYTTKLDALNGDFYVVLMQLVYDAVGPYSLTVEEVRRRLLWDLTLAHDAGSLESFLQAAALLPNAEGLLLPTAKKQKVKKAEASSATTSGNSSDAQQRASGVALSSRQPRGGNSQRETTQSRIAKLRCFEVKTTTAGGVNAATANSEKPYGFLELPWKHFPITGQRQRQVERLHKSAVEEVLMAMPRVPRPMYIGDVGNLIGKWAHFNARFDGALGVTLQVFLEAHPEAFRVVDRLVTRRTAGSTEQVRIRFDAEDENGNNNDDSDDDTGRSRKTRDRQLLTGQKGGKGAKAAIELPARARKKRAVKEFNKERFNRNYKSIDASARVPGYIKRGPRRIKGRGKKANKRVVKRGS